MSTSANDISNAIYIERLQQAVRVMEGLTDLQRTRNFDIGIIIRDSVDGPVGCIAGLCGLDPWFQERGFISDVDAEDLSMSISAFFGTARPFFRVCYNLSRPITVDDAIAALTLAINERSGDENVAA